MQHQLRKIARALRLNQRMSIREIRRVVPVAQSTLSLWLRDIPLNEGEIRKKRFDALKGNRHRQKDQGQPSKHFVGGSSLACKDKGRIAEAAVLFRLALRGYEVYGPAFEGGACDWLVMTASGPKRVEVRWAKQSRDGLPIISLRKSAGRKGSKRAAHDAFEFLVGYDLFSDTAYVFSAAEVAHLTSGISVRPEAAERWDKLG